MAYPLILAEDARTQSNKLSKESINIQLDKIDQQIRDVTKLGIYRTSYTAIWGRYEIMSEVVFAIRSAGYSVGLPARDSAVDYSKDLETIYIDWEE